VVDCRCCSAALPAGSVRLSQPLSSRITARAAPAAREGSSGTASIDRGITGSCPTEKGPVTRAFPGAGDQIRTGEPLEVILVVANIGTAACCIPSSSGSTSEWPLGYVTARDMESTVIMVGIFSLPIGRDLASGRAGAAGTDAAALCSWPSMTGRSRLTRACLPALGTECCWATDVSVRAVPRWPCWGLSAAPC
jgi:hypothetical protein